jgi:hypothetical protein
LFGDAQGRDVGILEEEGEIEEDVPGELDEPRVRDCVHDVFERLEGRPLDADAERRRVEENERQRRAEADEESAEPTAPHSTWLAGSLSLRAGPPTGNYR